MAYVLSNQSITFHAESNIKLHLGKQEYYMLKTRRKLHIWYILVVGYVISPSFPNSVLLETKMNRFRKCFFSVETWSLNRELGEQIDKGCEKSVANGKRRWEIIAEGRKGSGSTGPKWGQASFSWLILDARNLVEWCTQSPSRGGAALVEGHV